MGARLAMEAFIVLELQEVPILSRQSEVSRLYYLSSRYPDRRRAN